MNGWGSRSCAIMDAIGQVANLLFKPGIRLRVSKNFATMNERTLSYDFVAPPKIVFGWGRRRELGMLARRLGRRAMILSGLPAAVAADVLGEIREMLSTQDIEASLVETILHEPEVQDVDRVARELRGDGAQRGCFLLAIGGGAAIDLAKAAAVVATNRQSHTVADYLENVGRGLKIIDPPLSVLAMPTTAGTGAEATRNAVISSYDPPFKKVFATIASCRGSPWSIPSLRSACRRK